MIKWGSKKPFTKSKLKISVPRIGIRTWKRSTTLGMSLCHALLIDILTWNSYAERETYPYLQSIINETVANDQRLFLSHFTSTTHHPWTTPSKFQKEKYFANGLMGKHKDMNNYLNSVRYVDAWLGDILQVLDDTGIANETLVVLVGDQ